MTSEPEAECVNHELETINKIYSEYLYKDVEAIKVLTQAMINFKDIINKRELETADQHTEASE